MQFIDLKKQYGLIKEDVLRRMNAVLDSSAYIMGPEIGELESVLAGFVGSRRALSCASGTDALLLALMALGLKPGDEVIVPSFTFVATAEVVALLGARPVFADVDARTYNMDPDVVETLVGPAVRGIITVDLFGQAADYGRLGQIADRHGLWLVQDAAQSFGALWRGHRVPAQGLISCTSFFPAKPLGCYGDGGMVFTDDEELFAVMQSIRNHGQGSDRYENVRIGINGRLDTLQAAVLLAKFSIYEKEIALRQEVAARYGRGLAGVCTVPFIEEGNLSVFAQYCIRVPDRARVMARLKEKGVPTAIYYPIPLHRQKAFDGLGCRPEGSLPVCEEIARDIMALPMHPYLGLDEQDMIIAAVREACRG